MISALVSFFGGSAFRMLWGELSALWTKRQDHKHEIERMKLQQEMDAAAHARNLEAIRVQADLGIQTIRVQGEADLSKIDAQTFMVGVAATTTGTGIGWVDAWNASIRAALATLCMGLILLHFYTSGWVLDDRGWELCGAVLGMFVADRALFRRGK